MKTRMLATLAIALAAIMGLASIIFAIDVPTPDSLTISTSQSFGAALSTNFVYSGFSGVDFTGSGTSEGREGLSMYRTLYVSVKGTNSAGTGAMKVYYAISYDGTTFTTDNAATRYCDVNFRSNQTVVAAIRIAAHGIKQIAYAGTSVSSTDNGFTNLDIRVARSE